MPLLKFPYIMFSMTMITGSLMALSASNWLTMFAGMELNLLAFTPLMIQLKTSVEHESATKYLLAQILGASALILGGLWTLSPALSPLPPKWFILLGLMIKAGAAPAHFWFPNVMSGLSWPMCLILSTWQKLFPILCLFFLLNSHQPTALLMILAAGAMMAAHSGLNQSTLRGLLAYSSITHMNWMLSIAIMNTLYAALYMFIYLLSTLMIMLSLYTLNLSSQKISAITSLSPTTKLMLSTMFLSLASLPPFLGFLPKWQGLITLATFFPLIAFPLLFASLTTLFFYLKLSLMILLTPPNKQAHPPLPALHTVLPLLLISLGLAPMLPTLTYALTMLNQPQ